MLIRLKHEVCCDLMLQWNIKFWLLVIFYFWLFLALLNLADSSSVDLSSVKFSSSEKTLKNSDATIYFNQKSNKSSNANVHLLLELVYDLLISLTSWCVLSWDLWNRGCWIVNFKCFPVVSWFANLTTQRGKES